MKARVKATGEIFDVASVSLRLTGKVVSCYGIEEVDVLPHDETPDYWTRLEHQAAIGAIQGMIRRAYEAYCDDCANYDNMIFEDAQALLKDHAEALADVCVEYTRALVKKLKEKKERK